MNLDFPSSSVVDERKGGMWGKGNKWSAIRELKAWDGNGGQKKKKKMMMMIDDECVGMLAGWLAYTYARVGRSGLFFLQQVTRKATNVRVIFSNTVLYFDIGDDELSAKKRIPMRATPNAPCSCKSTNLGNEQGFSPLYLLRYVLLPIRP